MRAQQTSDAAAQHMDLLPWAAPIPGWPRLAQNYLPHQGSLTGKLQPPERGELVSSQSPGTWQEEGWQHPAQNFGTEGWGDPIQGLKTELKGRPNTGAIKLDV